MTDPFVLGMTLLSLGQVALSVTILIARSFRTPAYLALSVFLIAVWFLGSNHTLGAYFPNIEMYLFMAVLPTLLILGPSLWLYIEGLTSEKLWVFEAHHYRHLILFGLGIVCVTLLALLPAEEQRTMYIDGEATERLYPSLIIIGVFILLASWFGQAGYYLFKSVRHLSQYRERLRDVFSSTDKKELRWIGLVFGLLGLAWLISLAMITFTTVFCQHGTDQRYVSGLSLLVIWLLSVWGLRQKPGFEEEYTDSGPAGNSGPNSQPKYQKSALETDRAKRIAGKIETAMREDKLYLNSNLSLNKLSSHIGVTPNHISQTLNETMNSTFFGYVNRWRVDEAKRRLRESDDTTLEISIEVGFNSRSSFYKAFKDMTDNTPVEYRQHAPK